MKMAQEKDAGKAFADFVRSFDAQVPEHVVIDDEFYRKDERLMQISDSVSGRINRNPSSVSLYYGRYDKRRGLFTPGFPLLEMLAGNQGGMSRKQRIMVNEKGEWLFLCKRNILESSILNADHVRDLLSDKGVCGKDFFVVNRHDELLGMGVITLNRGSIVVKNRIDRGNFLRRERR
ncbi:hypothetical protein JW968_06600 [Candidatus Woesearchaeota archaeon]|nr:hypothetical protein [Candidatus Woesearchaeota archaeon]